MAIQSSMSVPLDDVDAVTPYEITFTDSSSPVRLLLASFDDGGPFTSGQWTTFVNGVASYLTGQGYGDVTLTALTTTEV
jgi:hypothetical protein